MKINVLAILAHPDDAELSCAGTLIIHQRLGKTTGVIDMTQGEMGTRGSTEIRKTESERAAGIMKLSIRENLGFEDAFFKNDRDHQIEVVKRIRRYQPDIVITNAVYDRHPDHARAAQLVEDACFLSGLIKLETRDGDAVQPVWRPQRLLFAIQSTALVPDLLVDITEAMEDKMKAIEAYESQFYKPETKEPETYISTKQFLDMIRSRCLEFGQRIQVGYAEGFNTRQAFGVKSLYHLI